MIPRTFQARNRMHPPNRQSHKSIFICMSSKSPLLNLPEVTGGAGRYNACGVHGPSSLLQGTSGLSPDGSLLWPLTSASCMQTMLPGEAAFVNAFAQGDLHCHLNLDRGGYSTIVSNNPFCMTNHTSNQKAAYAWFEVSFYLARLAPPAGLTAS